MAQTETIQQPFKYAGQVGIQAEGNNLYYMRARYYDANLGRFISEDPIGHNGGLNLYAYVGGNPIMAVDPSGLVDVRNLGFGMIDFTLSTGEAIGGMGVAISSTAGGPLAPAGYYVGIGAAYHGITGMANSGLAIQNALFETNGPGLFEGIGGALLGANGGKIGKTVDLVTGIRPGAIAAGTFNSASDIYNIASSINTMKNEFGNGSATPSQIISNTSSGNYCSGR